MATNVSSFDRYTQSLPKDKGMAALRSFAASGVAVTILSGGNFILGCAAGTVAATWSLVEALARPIINKIFGYAANDDRINRGWFFAAKTCVVILLASVLSAPILGVTMSVFFSLFLTIAVNHKLFFDKEHQPADKANSYVLV